MAEKETMSQNGLSLKNVLTEQDLGDLLGMKPSQIASLRYEGLPFIKVNQRTRLYFEPDVVEWFQGRRMIMSTDEET